jgi:hypothetical protein
MPFRRGGTRFRSAFSFATADVGTRIAVARGVNHNG